MTAKAAVTPWGLTRVSDYRRWLNSRPRDNDSKRVTNDNNPKRGGALMIGEAQDLLTALGRSLARSGPDGWRELELKISAAGGMTATSVCD